MISNGVGMPGVEAEGGTPDGESDTVPPPSPQKEEGEARSEEKDSARAVDTEEEEEEEQQKGKWWRVPSPPTIGQLFSAKIMLACKLSLLFLALVIVVQSR